MRSLGTALMALGGILMLVPQAAANPDQAKLYKEVFGGDKPKCIVCHTDKLPKKGDGKHDLNDYGKKVVAIDPEHGEDAYRKAGPAPA